MLNSMVQVVMLLVQVVVVVLMMMHRNGDPLGPRLLRLGRGSGTAVPYPLKGLTALWRTVVTLGRGRRAHIVGHVDGP